MNKYGLCKKNSEIGIVFHLVVKHQTCNDCVLVLFHEGMKLKQ